MMEKEKKGSPLPLGNHKMSIKPNMHVRADIAEGAPLGRGAMRERERGVAHKRTRAENCTASATETERAPLSRNGTSDGGTAETAPLMAKLAEEPLIFHIYSIFIHLFSTIHFFSLERQAKTGTGE